MAVDLDQKQEHFGFDPQILSVPKTLSLEDVHFAGSRTSAPHHVTGALTEISSIESRALPALAPARPLTKHPPRRAHRPSKPPRAPKLMSYDYGTVTFYVVADSPYNSADARRLKKQMKNLPADAEFVLHLGDIRSAASGALCQKKEYNKVARIFQLSFAPVFLVLGDNDWSDCPNPTQALKHWNTNFLSLYNRYWNSSFVVAHMQQYPQNYYWIWKGTLFVGLDLPGSVPFDVNAWKQQLSEQSNWTITVIGDYSSQMIDQGLVGQVVLFAQANPTKWHDPFFTPLVNYIENVLKNKLPILYLNGDTHVWNFTPNFFGQKSFLRINLTGETINPPLKMMINGSFTRQIPSDQLFRYDRQLN